MKLFLISFSFGFLFYLSYGLNVLESKFSQLPTQEEFECTTDEQCQSFIEDSKCIHERCKCSSDRVLSSDGTKCLITATEYGSPCEENIQCSTKLSSGGICENKECVCKSGYHYLKGSCWKNTGLHGKCFKDEQCFAAYEYIGFKCENNKCICRKNYRQRLNSGCRREGKINEACNLDDDCIDGSKCERMICSAPGTEQRPRNTFSPSNMTIAGAKRVKTSLKCGSGMFELNNVCVRELGMTCSSDPDCSHIKQAICLDNTICACRPAKYVASENNRNCLQVTLGKVEDIRKSSCKKDAQCGVFGENTFCQNQRCACKNGTYFETESKFCWEVKPPGESCSDDKDCHPSESHAECVETNSKKLCTCKKGYHAKEFHCVPDALKVGDPCENDSECLFPNSFCNSSKICACRKHYYPKDGKCEPGVGTKCVTNDDCAHLNHTECKIKDLPIKQCLCLENYTNSDDYKYCLPVADYKRECQESFQCQARMGQLGECKQNICECLEGAHYYSGMCYKSVFLGERCSKRPDCYPGNDTNSVLCLNGYCSCNYDYHKLDGTVICIKTNSAATVKLHLITLMPLLLFLSLGS